jgi:hypothetical protein
MPYQRDPLSVRYDGVTRDAVMRAIRASRGGKGVQVWVASTRGEHRSPDAGGRTAHERAFTRSAYYLVWRAPINAGRIPDWSLKLSWGPDDALKASSNGRLARPARLRIFVRRGPRGGREHGYALPAPRQWSGNPELQSGGIGSGKERFPAG